MWIALAFTVLLLHLVLHELAHAVAIRRLGGQVQAAGLGLPLPPMLVVRAPARLRVRELTLSPWLLGAYVEPDEKTATMLDQLGYRDRAWYAGAGVVANLLIAEVSWSAMEAVKGNLLASAVCLGAAAVTWFARRWITAAIPVIGVACVALYVHTLVTTFGEPTGPITLGKVVAQTSGLQSLLLLSGALGIALAVANCIPMFPFDGGRVMNAALEHLTTARFAARFRAVTAVFAVVLIVYGFVSDFL